MRNERRAVVLGLATVGALLSFAVAQGAPHPSLLITPDDIPRLQHACGTARIGASAPASFGRAGARAAEFQSLREHVVARRDAELLPGELIAAAFLHLVDPDDAGDARRLAIISHALRQPDSFATDPMEYVLALDWCWDALDAEARQEFLLEVRTRLTPLAPADSPLNHAVFADKLVGLALAIAIDGADDPSPSWTALREQLLAGARKYFEDTFPTFARWRGLAPTSPAVGPWEERDTVLAVELAAGVFGRDMWPDYRDTVGRWLEHYVYATLASPALEHDFLRDDGNLAPLTPAPKWAELLPVTAHLLALRTHDPAAALLAQRVEQRLRGPSVDIAAVPWLWVPIVLDTSAIPACDATRLPAARNFGGAVMFRSGRGPGEVGVWIEAGQPFLRKRQHFDAGHFLISSGSELTVGAGDDITFEAVASKRGAQHLGYERKPFDFEQYFCASIAHNCLLLYDPIRVPRWYNQRFVPAGGQRPIENTCTDFTGSLDDNPRQTARQLAYGLHADTGYVALDLLPAYEPRVATSYTREFIFVAGRALVVIDRLGLAGSRAEPIWVLNIPVRPTVDGADLSHEKRREGKTDEAGVWSCDDAASLRWKNGAGTLWMCPLLPEPRRLNVVGGPATRRPVPSGPYAGRTYIGGDADGFERLVRPVGRDRPQNVWYRLGEPTLLGPTFGAASHWGRIEIEPAQKSDTLVFLTALVVESPDAARPPSAKVERSGQTFVVSLDTGLARAVIRVPPGTDRGGTVEIAGATPETWTLPSGVEADAALPTE